MNPYGERGSQERPIAYVRRRKSGLEVPLVGRFYGENKLLMFAPPMWHDLLVLFCVLIGGLGTLGSFMGADIPGGLLVCGLLLIAGLWGAISNERMVCDLRFRTFKRYEGIGPGKHVIKGTLDDLDALVLTSEQYMGSSHVIYRLILYWKGMRHPPLIVDQERQWVPAGAPLNHMAHAIFQRGVRYSQAMKLPYYDNSHMYGKSPVPVL